MLGESTKESATRLAVNSRYKAHGSASKSLGAKNVPVPGVGAGEVADAVSPAAPKPDLRVDRRAIVAACGRGKAKL